MVCPFWNWTLGRSLYVQTCAFAFGVHLTASSGLSGFACRPRMRYSPVIPPTTTPPWLLNVHGSVVPVSGPSIPSLSLPPALTAARLAWASGASPSAPSTAPTAPTDSPKTEARRKNSPRSMSPSVNSSIRVLAAGPSFARSSSKCLLLARVIRLSPFRLLGADARVERRSASEVRVASTDRRAPVCRGAIISSKHSRPCLTGDPHPSSQADFADTACNFGST